METLIDGTGLTRHYPTRDRLTRAVDGVDVCLLAGEFVAVMGPSGCGKSTLLHLLGGLERPTSGTLRVQGQRVEGLGERGWARLRRTAIGFVFQSANLVPTMTVADNVGLPALLAGVRPAPARVRAMDLLERLGVADKASWLPGALSGGQQQRVAIARAMVNSPPLLLADEPTGALDSRATGRVLRLLREIHEAGVGIVLVTHDARVATAADRLLTMRDGRLVEETRLDGAGASLAMTDLLDTEAG